MSEKLEHVLIEQLEAQGYNTNFLTLVWNNADNVEVFKGQNITLEIIGTNDLAVKGEFSITYQFGEEEIIEKSVNWELIIGIFFVIVAILIGLMIVSIIWQRTKNKKV